MAPLIAAVEEALGPRVPSKLAVAVSGGGDSIALLSVLAKYASDRGVDLHVITVDHGLRPEFNIEVKAVTDLCQKLGLPHHLEFWSGWTGAGNMQAEARGARYALMADWAYGNQVDQILLAHTADDQAETVLMRLARSAGVDGLSAMPVRHTRFGIAWVRPFLNIRRETLRLYLQAAGLHWVDDPSNANRNFERVRIRDALTVLQTLGISVDALVDVAGHMRQAREALDWQTFLVARDLVDIVAGAVVVKLNRFRAQPVEVKRRLLMHALMWVSSNPYPARRNSLMRALEAVAKGKTITLEGCQISVFDSSLWLFREHNAVTDVACQVGDTWDDRWIVDGPHDDPEIKIRAVGFDVLSKMNGWREAGVPRAVLAATPSVWYGDQVLAAPVAVEDDEWSAQVDGGEDGFFAALLSH